MEDSHDDEGFLGWIMRAFRGDNVASGERSSGLTSEGAMRKVRRLIAEEKEALQPREMPPGDTPVVPDEIAEASTMIEVERETTEGERAAQSRAEQIKTLHKLYWRNLTLAFVILLASIVLFRQT